LLLHAAFLGIAAACLTAGWWQIHRAMQGNTLSYLYSVEWPAFVVVAGIGWWQMVHDTPEDIAARRRFREQMRAASAEVVARTLPRSAFAISAESRESVRILESGLPPRSQLSSGAPDDDGAVRVPTRIGRDLSVVDVEDAERLLAPEQEPGQGDELSEYNRYLALLAIKGKSKTWRNPRGL
jgi:hypothetical protein